MTENTVTGVTPDELPEALRLDRERTPIDEAADAYYEEYLALHPDAATIEGRPGHETEYSDYSPAGEEADVELARRTLETVNALEPRDAVDRVTLDVLNERLGLQIEMHLAGLGAWELNPLATEAHGIRQIFDLMPQRTAQDWAHIVGRMANVPAAIDGFIETLEHHREACRVAAARQVRLLVEQFRAYAQSGGFFDGLAEQAVTADAGLDGSAQDAARAAAGAYHRLADHLEQVLLPEAPEEDAVGIERYRLHSRQFLGAEVDLAETYRWGVEELERIIAEQEQVAEQIRPGASIAEAKRALDADPDRRLEGTDALREWMQGVSDRAVEFLAREHFTIEGPMRTIECMIAPTHDGGIYYTPPSADFSRPGRMWWSVPEGETQFTTWAETSTVYHEGVPGHHLQFATGAALASSVNDYRAHGVWVSGHGEGWALYAERLMEQLGYLEDPGDRMGMLDGQRMRAARVVFDIGVHCGFEIPQAWAEQIGHSGTWTAEAGHEFLAQNLDISEGQREFEFHRYLGWPGQAPSYKIGQRIWEQLRDEALQRGESLREFHTRALLIGSVGLDTLRRALQDPEA